MKKITFKKKWITSVIACICLPAITTAQSMEPKVPESNKPAKEKHAASPPGKKESGKDITPHSSPEVIASIDEITRIHSEIALLQARKKALELQAEIAAKKAEMTSDAVIFGGSKTDAAPVVKSIEGVNGKLMAAIQVGAAEQMVKKGEKINGWTVSKINGVSVTLKKGKQTRNIAFGKELTTINSQPSNDWPKNDIPSQYNPANFPQ